MISPYAVSGAVAVYHVTDNSDHICNILYIIYFCCNLEIIQHTCKSLHSEHWSHSCRQERRKRQAGRVDHGHKLR